VGNKFVTYLGGQPGAGKSYLIVEDKLNAVVIDSDSIHENHPLHGKIAEKDIYDLDKECYKWGSMLIQDAVKEGKFRSIERVLWKQVSKQDGRNQTRRCIRGKQGLKKILKNDLSTNRVGGMST
jgi:predicted kinase